MIGCFPNVYPDELVYSWMARYYVQSGYVSYDAVAKDVFVNGAVPPDIEFFKELTEDVLQVMTKNISMEDIVLNHTMFPYYARFLPKERRKRAFKSLCSMNGEKQYLLANARNDKEAVRYLRYCPLCSSNDRKQHKQTFWHRSHQLLGIDVCPIHGCYLCNSDVIIKGKRQNTLISAEESVPRFQIVKFPKNDFEYTMAKYIWQIFEAEIDWETSATIGEFLHSKMENTKYVSVRGKQKNLQALYMDLMDYYKDLQMELAELKKILDGSKCNTYEICLIAMFLSIDVSEVVHMKLPDKKQMELFDEQIYALREQGLKYTEIVEQLNIPYSVVAKILENVYGKSGYHKRTEPKKSGRKQSDWKTVDENTLPLVRQAIEKVQNDNSSFPKRIRCSLINDMLDLPKKRIESYLPRCREEIAMYEETQEHYWARKLIWAVQKIMEDGLTVNCKRIHLLVHLKKQYLSKCFPEVCEIADEEVIEIVRGLL